MPTYEIPLIPAPQTLSVTVGNAALRLSLQWCPSIGGGTSIWDLGASIWDGGASIWDGQGITDASWIMDISTTGGNNLVSGLPLVPGSNLLEQFDHLNIAGQLWIQTDGDADAIPVYDNLGTSGRLYLVTT